ncbi:hypothetical protein LT493_26310 [Streptomyces tricolor]|nr:hypothetical protein [Streptomyces tricolor]
MTRFDDLLSRACLVRGTPRPPRRRPPYAPAASSPARPCGTTADGDSHEAAEDLKALCETVLTHTPPTTFADFLTEQVPQPRGALALACVLQLTDTDDGARMWWQLAAGAGQPAAAYCLYLHHLAQGEQVTAQWWHQQTDDLEPPPEPTACQEHHERGPAPAWHPAAHTVTSTSTTTLLRVLRHLAKLHRPPSSDGPPSPNSWATSPQPSPPAGCANPTPTSPARPGLRRPDHRALRSCRQQAGHLRHPPGIAPPPGNKPPTPTRPPPPRPRHASTSKSPHNGEHLRR